MKWRVSTLSKIRSYTVSNLPNYSLVNQLLALLQRAGQIFLGSTVFSGVSAHPPFLMILVRFLCIFRRLLHVSTHPWPINYRSP